MKFSTALKRARAEMRRELRSVDLLYDECPLCQEESRRWGDLDDPDLDRVCVCCPFECPIPAAMGWPNDEEGECYLIGFADAQGDPLARRIVGEILLNLEAQGD